ncbi:MAG TPA: aldose epimerase family protein [Ignavibacteriaceae bacterium]|nr:aldose epimerase family protein [Ignavibacteriaceae bacterium]
MTKLCSVICILLYLILFSQANSNAQTKIEKRLFGTLPDGREVYAYTLKNSSGMKAEIIQFGAIVRTLSVPDRNGKFSDIVLGYDDLKSYENQNAYFGSIVGRYGNRIAKGKFTLDGKDYQLTVNSPPNHLHGGVAGFSKVLWNAQPVDNPENPALKLTYVSKDGEEGYPGTVTITVTYTLTKDNELRIDYKGTTDKTTIFNPTHHSYFNLTGDPTNTILDHELMINADTFTPVDANLIPTGELKKVEGNPFDFRKPEKIGARINEKDEQLRFGRGYDHNWVLNGYNKSVRLSATVYDPKSGRYMEVLTDQPGLQFYSGNFLDGSAKGKNGISYGHRTGLCLEAQVFPDSPNKKNFPSAVLKPGETYHQTTIYKFSTK